MNNHPNRKSTHLSNYNYAQNGSVFITICLQNKRERFCSVFGNKDNLQVFSKLTDEGLIADKYIGLISSKFSNVTVDNYCIMPDHMHLLLTFRECTLSQRKDLNAVVGWLKYFITKEVNLMHNAPGRKFLQRSYYDHVIRDLEDYGSHFEYINSNASSWLDKHGN